MALFGHKRKFIPAGARKSRARLGVLILTMMAALVALAAMPAFAHGVGTGVKGANGNSTGGGGNYGTVKLHTNGDCTQVNAEFLNHGGVCDPDPDDEDDPLADPRHVPHLPCDDIQLIGIEMNYASDTYTIDVIPPTGDHKQVYPTATTSGTWNYDKTAGGEQVMDVIDVETLVANAIAAGAEAHPIQGYHFKLQFTQAPQKHKTFWVHCNAPEVTPSPSPSSSPSPEGSPSPESSPSPEGSPSPEVCPAADQMIVSHSFLINGTTELDDISGKLNPGDHVKAIFTLAAGCSNQQLSLISYKAPSATFDENTADQQTVFDSDTGFFNAGEGSLEVDVPGCFFQVDFVRGPVIEHLGNGHFYGDMKIDWDNGGTETCEEVQPSPSSSPTPEGSPSPESSPSPEGSPSPESSPSPEGSPSPTGDVSPEASASPSESASSSPSPLSGVLGASGAEAPNTGHGDWIQGGFIALLLVIAGVIALAAFREKKAKS
ncbi:MAG: hypothetical protein QOE92_1354 [Chloroflexota bacterium]|jgi:hypothetical protein|nr:hypothetical protein [Chloroflexota bacterium]